MVQVLNYHEQVKLTTMKPCQFVYYNNLFKPFYKISHSGTINRTHGLCLGDWMERFQSSESVIIYSLPR